MAELINFFQLDLSVSVSSFSRSAVSGSNSARSAGLTSAGRSAAAAGINAGAGVTDINNSRVNQISSDGILISNSARALEFLSNSLVKNGFSRAEAEAYTSRYAQDPELDGELSRLFTLLEPLFDDKSKFRENVEKFMANFARITGRAPNRQISASLQDLASKIENIKNNKEAGAAATANIAAVEVSVEIRVVEGRVEFIQKKQTDPLIIDMDADGFELTDADGGAEFDIDADGATDKTAVTKGNDAMLALDLNGNGVIDNGKELFGDQNGAKDGFAELAKYDGNADGKIDADDGVFDGLKLLRFVKNAAGGYKQEIKALKSSGITAINLLNTSAANEKINGNSIVKKSLAYLDNNNDMKNSVNIADALLENYRL